MASRISNGAAAAAVNAVVTQLDAGGAAGHIEIRTGAQPADVQTPATGTLLGTLVLSNPAFGAATSANPAVSTAATITGDSSADASGTAGWYRGYDSNNNAVIDGAITATGGGGEMELDDTNIVAGGTITVTSWTVSMPTGA